MRPVTEHQTKLKIAFFILSFVFLNIESITNFLHNERFTLILFASSFNKSSLNYVIYYRATQFIILNYDCF